MKKSPEMGALWNTRRGGPGGSAQLTPRPDGKPVKESPKTREHRDTRRGGPGGSAQLTPRPG
jgi:hypothetical protein